MYLDDVKNVVNQYGWYFVIKINGSSESNKNIYILNLNLLNKNR
jgi:hypothetical protein